MPDNTKFYQKQYWRKSDDRKYEVACPPELARHVVIALPSAQYGYGTPIWMRFDVPADDKSLRDVEELLCRAYELGRLDKAGETADILHSLLRPKER